MSGLECPYCREELIHEDSFGTLEALRGNEPLNGDIYRCQNHEGFQDKDLTECYVQNQDYPTLKDYMLDNGVDSWEDIFCDSSVHNVSGTFYVYRNDGILREGYPC